MKKQKINSYKDLIVWQEATKLALLTYRVTDAFPSKENYVLTSQILRAVISIPSNIAEGYARRATRDYVRFLRIAYGSLAELETQLYIAQKQKYLNEVEFEELQEKMTGISKMLSVLIKRLLSKKTFA